MSNLTHDGQCYAHTNPDGLHSYLVGKIHMGVACQDYHPCHVSFSFCVSLVQKMVSLSPCYSSALTSSPSIGDSGTIPTRYKIVMMYFKITEHSEQKTNIS